MEESLEKYQNEIEELNHDLSFAKGRRVFFEHYRKVKKAILMKSFEPAYPTAAAQEREALADPQYLDVLKSLEHWTGEYEMLYLKRKDLEYKFEKWRTQMANQRAERQRYGA